MRKERREDSPNLPSMGILVTLARLETPRSPSISTCVCDSPAKSVHYALDYYNTCTLNSFSQFCPCDDMFRSHTLVEPILSSRS